MATKDDIAKASAGAAFGTPPPPGAPVQVSDKQIVGDVLFGAVTDREGKTVVPAKSAREMARQHEQELAPYAPQPMTDAQIYALIGKTREQVLAGAKPSTDVVIADLNKTTLAAIDRATVEASQRPPQDPNTPIRSPLTLVDPSGKPLPSATVTTTDGIVDSGPRVPSIKPADVLRPRRLRRPGLATPVDATVSSAFISSTSSAEVPLTVDDTVPVDVTDSASDSVVVSAPAVDTRPVPYRPAASDTDTPSRGLPTFATDPGKRITGGFSDAADAQYFPLDGSELRALVRALLDNLDRRLDDDLRFSIAASYPRVNARVVIEVECLAFDQSFQIPAVMVPHDKTPMKVAREYGDQVVFALVADRSESDAAGNSITPPNATRLEIGLPIPRKQAVQTPGGRQIVDVK